MRFSRAAVFWRVLRSTLVRGLETLAKTWKKSRETRETFCFGGRVTFIPSPIRDAKNSDKWAGKERPGIFIGYVLKTGGKRTKSKALP